MQRLVPLTLILLTIVTSLALGTARGQAQAGRRVELCAGQTVQIKVVERDGRTLRRASLCPDMADSVLDVVAPAPSVLPRPALRWRTAPAPQWIADAPAGMRPRPGRGPPRSADADPTPTRYLERTRR